MLLFFRPRAAGACYRPSGMGARAGLAPGSVVGDAYRIRRLIGSGGMGDVYAAEGYVVEVKPLRSRLEDIFVDAVQDAGSAGAAHAAKPQPALSRR